MFRKALFGLVLLLLLFPSKALAQTTQTKVSTLKADEVVDHDYFVASEMVEISGTVNGDVYAAGGQVIVDGTVNGDLLVAGGSVTISGDITGDIRAGGGQLLFTGNTGRNVSAVGGSIEFTDTALVGGSIATAAGSVVINSAIDGDINAAVGNMRLSSNAVVSGDINYVSEEDISRSETASVSGTVNRKQAPRYNPPSEDAVEGFLAGVGLFAKLMSLATSLVIGLLMLKFLPNYTKNASNIVNNRFLPSLAVGFLGLVIVPALIGALFITIIGIPLALIIATAFFLYLYVVRVFAIVAIGQKIAQMGKFKANSYIIFTVGIVAYYLLTMIPVFGWIIKILVLIASFGAALVNERDTWRKATKENVV